MPNHKPEPPDHQHPNFRMEYLINDASRIRRSLMDQIFRPLGITRSQWLVLSALSRSGTAGMMQVDLARLLEITKGTVGGLVERLEATGYITRVSDATDRRVKRVFITPLGFEVLDKMIGVTAKLNQRIYENISPARQKMVEEVLFDVKQNLKTILAELGGIRLEEVPDELERAIVLSDAEDLE